MKRFILLLSLLSIYSQALAADIKILTTIKPLQSIVQNIVGDITEVKLLLDKNDSPHNFTLKPSDAKLIHSADIVFYFSPSFETFIEKISTNADLKNNLVNLSANTPNIKIYSGREKNFWEYKNDTPTTTKTNFHKKYQYDEQSKTLKKIDTNHHDHAHNHNEHDHDHSTDYHLWLDVDNVILMADYIKSKLSILLPEHKNEFEQNYKIFIKKLIDLDSKLSTMLADYQNVYFIVYHDAYQYFERKYNLSSKGSITINPFIQPSAKKIQDLTALIKANNIRCIFAEPQFPPKMVETIKNSTGINSGILDPEWGANENSDIKSSYFDMMLNLAANMVDCFKKE